MKSYTYLFAGIILFSGNGYAQEGAKQEKKEIRVEVETEDPGETYHVKIISENEDKEKIYEKTYSSLEDLQADSTISIQVTGDRQKIFHIQADKLAGDFEWTSTSDSLGKKGMKTAGGNFVVIHAEEDEPAVHISSESDTLVNYQSYEIRIGNKSDTLGTSGDEKEISQEIWVLKEKGNSATDLIVGENKQRIRIVPGHRTPNATTGSPSEVKEARIQDISLADEDFPDFNIDRMPVLKLKTLHYYPNPSAGEFTLTFSGPKNPVIIRILDEKGNLMYEENLKIFSGNYNRVMNVKRFNKGKYLLQIHQQGRVLNKKLVVE